MEAGYDRFEAQEISKHANEDVPEVCPKCGKNDELDEGGGMVGEPIIFCKRCSEVIWEDSEDAIRRVL
jgi:RNA polymerase subunit RPABC4/transcription elongation factor Spt4